jgi:thymidine kinase
MGSLHIVLGPMFSGKTTYLIDVYKNLMNNGQKVCVINYSGDTRYHEHMLSTHTKIMIPCIQLSALSNFDMSPYDCILINEGQFFQDLKENVLDYVDNMKKTRLCCRTRWRLYTVEIRHYIGPYPLLRFRQKIKRLVYYVR